MRRFVTATVGLGTVVLATTTGAPATDKCPAELTQAKAALKRAQASQDIQSPRAQAGARSQDIQAPRGQQEIPVPRGQDIQAPRADKAAALVQEADAACKKGDMALSAKKAGEALGLLR